ncbi:MAG: hypothetical protein PHT07_07790 [Paludibacter sp.]|nr:hypothetical protein [Paludibacter sp.]
MERELGTRILMNEITRISVNSFGIPAKLEICLNNGQRESGVLKGFDFRNNFISDSFITLILFDEGKEVKLDLNDVQQIKKI